ncbi:hypothetical protein [Paenibacillus peoriae]|uniref:hypothetical protein n=1 Tax=Paenibacillus peoriae TaxID=59893 RepID=UPI00096F88B2|nr:hypothetical protein [Paenibacillus peoriae]OMF48593.1 hypothetical protein BK135_09860 [Paenibacillus peoriae]
MSRKGDVEWTVTNPKAGSAKHEYVAKLKVSEDFNDSQKDMVTNFNSMRDFLFNNGLMEKKGS